jgi:hypothetical protein
MGVPMSAVTTIFTGEIGFDYSTTTYNSTTRRSESTSGTVWRQAPYTHNLRNEHPGDQPDMQVYASYRSVECQSAAFKRSDKEDIGGCYDFVAASSRFGPQYQAVRFVRSADVLSILRAERRTPRLLLTMWC